MAVEYDPAWRSDVSKTEIDLTVTTEAKKRNTRPVGKAVFENTYLKKELTQFVLDLKKEFS